MEFLIRWSTIYLWLASTWATLGGIQIAINLTQTPEFSFPIASGILSAVGGPLYITCIFVRPYPQLSEILRQIGNQTLVLWVSLNIFIFAEYVIPFTHQPTPDYLCNAIISISALSLFGFCFIIVVILTLVDSTKRNDI